MKITDKLKVDWIDIFLKIAKPENYLRSHYNYNQRFLYYTYLHNSIPENYRECCEDKSLDIKFCDYALDEECPKTCNYYANPFRRIKFGLLKLFK